MGGPWGPSLNVKGGGGSWVQLIWRVLLKYRLCHGMSICGEYGNIGRTDISWDQI
jgi:hypothetical protein